MAMARPYLSRSLSLSLIGCLVAAGAAPHGLNVLEGKTYPHHPVMLQVPLLHYEIQPGMLTELAGLKVPLQFDCKNFWNGSQHSEQLLDCNYYNDVVARRLHCHEHQARIDAGISHCLPALPLMDDDYGEHVAVYQSVLRHRSGRPFRVAELGARWGTWGARAVALWRMLNGQEAPYEVFFVEISRRACHALRLVMSLNQIKHHLLCGPATPELFLKMMRGIGFMDLLHIDIQHKEKELLQHPAVEHFLRTSVARIIVGTHSKRIHEQIAERYKDWFSIMNYGLATSWGCRPHGVAYNLQPTSGVLSPNDWVRIRNSECFDGFPRTPQGRVMNSDGLLILDNPSWVEPTKRFFLNDTELRVDDLKLSAAYW